MSTALSLTNIANNAKKQYLATLKTANNVVSALTKGTITEANARNIGRNMGLTENAVNGMLRMSRTKAANERGAQALINISRHRNTVSGTKRARPTPMTPQTKRHHRLQNNNFLYTPSNNRNANNTNSSRSNRRRRQAKRATRRRR
jgi:hypothetical protein